MIMSLDFGELQDDPEFPVGWCCFPSCYVGGRSVNQRIHCNDIRAEKEGKIELLSEISFN